MGFFKRNKKTGISSPVKRSPQNPGQGRPSGSPMGSDVPPVDPWSGDEELAKAAAAVEAGNWSLANYLIDQRGEDGWTASALQNQLKVEHAAVAIAEGRTARSLTMLGAAMVNNAWEVRGSGMASTVGHDAAVNFMKLLRSAQDVLREAIELDDSEVQARTHLIKVGMGLGAPKDDLRTLYDEIHARRPFHPPAVSAITNALAEKWGGDEGAALDFTRSVDAGAPAGHPAHGALARAVFDAAYYRSHFQGGNNVGSAMDTHYDEKNKYRAELTASMVKLVEPLTAPAPPSHVGALNWHFFVSDTKDVGDAAEPLAKLLAVLGDRPTEYPWTSMGSSKPANGFQMRKWHTNAMIQHKRR